MKKFPLSYRMQLISGLFALLCIPMIFIAEATGWFGDELFHLPQWIATTICFISGIIVLVKRKSGFSYFHTAVSLLGVVLSGMYLALIVFVLGLFIGPEIKNSIKYRNFDAQVWNQSEESDARVYMADDLIRDKTLIGLTKTEVIELLGEPFYRDPNDGSTFPYGAYESDIHYKLGNARGFLAIDWEWLMITFGDDGKVDRCWLYED